MKLDASCFPDFFHACHGRDPFPWQQRLVEQLLKDGHWPDLLDLPTGTGKTSTLDVALFTLASDPLRFPRRIVMVIDRRVVVDQAADHARTVQKKLNGSDNPVARQVAARLRAMWDGPENLFPFEVTVMRGGMPREDAWTSRPDRPVIAVSTVDQVGSRLLFRGYGVSERMSSVHAGLLGHDTLFLLDEVHLSIPFAQTLSSLKRYWRSFYGQALQKRWEVSSLSATPVLRSEYQPFCLDERDRNHPVLSKRLAASKLAELRLVKVSADEEQRRSSFALACEQAVKDQLADGVMAIAVVVNRVDTARRVSALLERDNDMDVCLLTGRMRPLDREQITAQIMDRVKAGRDRQNCERPIVVVSTQAIEVGADFDFDALVTECASFDALRQRFGRLDRLGQMGTSKAVILVRSDALAKNANDPVYGDAIRETWEWLQSLDRVDFGIKQLPQPDPEQLIRLVPPIQNAPVLLPAHIDTWSHTHPRPSPDPDITLWLHGPRRGEPEVQIVWRADIKNEDLNLDAADANKLILERISACPPSALEAMSLPLSSVRRWLRSQPDRSGLADVPAQDEDEDTIASKSRLAFLWQGDRSRIVTADGLYPGCTLVVPAEYGGIANGNWDPESNEPVSDLGDIAQWRQRARATLRVNQDVLASSWASVPPLPDLPDDASTSELRDILDEWLQALQDPRFPELSESLQALMKGYQIIPHDDGSVTLVAKQRWRSDSGVSDISTEDDVASFTASEVTLDQHLRDVRTWARRFAQSVGLSQDLAEDLELAAWLHDLGKADPRFQKWLVGGSEVRYALQDVPLAKSGHSGRDLAARQLARKRAGYPDGYRHELLSIAMAENSNWVQDRAHDMDLVLHLIGSHHGYCRPFAPVADGQEEIPVTLRTTSPDGESDVEFEANTNHRLEQLESGLADRFWRLTRRYGWWGLAYLEAMLRLADHRASEFSKSGGHS